MVREPAVTDAARSFFDRLLALSREAHGCGFHEVAYHALIGAMHAAQSGHDRAGVALTADEAREQINWIDTHVPGHRLSTSSAARHDHPGVYAMLCRQAEMVVRQLAREAGREERMAS
jgi:hypothetical protein